MSARDLGVPAGPGAPKEADDCLVTIRRLGPYLLVTDNLRCGGLNVSFGGLYVREPKK